MWIAGELVFSSPQNNLWIANSRQRVSETPKVLRDCLDACGSAITGCIPLTRIPTLTNWLKWREVALSSLKLETDRVSDVFGASFERFRKILTFFRTAQISDNSIQLKWRQPISTNGEKIHSFNLQVQLQSASLPENQLQEQVKKFEKRFKLKKKVKNFEKKVKNFEKQVKN